MRERQIGLQSNWTHLPWQRQEQGNPGMRDRVTVLTNKTDQVIARRNDISAIIKDHGGVAFEPGIIPDSAKITAIAMFAFFDNAYQRERIIKEAEQDPDIIVERNSDLRKQKHAEVLKEVERPRYGIPLRDILKDGPIIAQRKPVATFGHFLSSLEGDNLSSTPPQRTDPEIARLLHTSYVLVPVIDDGEIRRLQENEPRLTSEIVMPVRNVRRAYEYAVAGMRRQLQTPDRNIFPQVIELFDRTEQFGTDQQNLILLNSLLQVFNQNEIHKIYRQFHEHSRRGTFPEFFEKLRGEISAVYEGTFYPDPHLAGLPTPQEERPIADIESELMRLKSRLWPHLPATDAILVSPPDSTHSENNEASNEVMVQRGESGVKGTTLEIIIPITVPSGESRYLVLDVYNGYRPDWNLVNTPDELPELYRSVTNLGRDTLSLLAKAIKNDTRSSDRTSRNGNNSRTAFSAASSSASQSIPERRVTVPDADRNGSEVNGHAYEAHIATTTDETNGVHLPIDFDPEALEGIDPRVKKDIQALITRHNQNRDGNRLSKQVYDGSFKGDRYYGRAGNARVFFRRNEEGTAYVYDGFADRKKAYQNR